ncbi:hypothetical protein DAI22_01g092408 [Oryza sativa Japonica Group]|nr:hypothetical protein DAI22_01g092408 [Oryza sativa Japonica Group]
MLLLLCYSPFWIISKFHDSDLLVVHWYLHHQCIMYILFFCPHILLSNPWKRKRGEEALFFFFFCFC